MLTRPRQAAQAPNLSPFTVDQIVSVLGSPRANVEANWPLVYAALAEVGAGDRLPCIAALATIGVECSVFRPIEEYRNADGSIPSYWYSYDGGPEYHGRGFVQITHRSNYRHYGDLLGVDLVGNPDLALDATISAKILAFYFDEHGIPDLARGGRWVAVRRAVNGGTNGLAEFLRYVQAFETL